MANPKWEGAGTPMTAQRADTPEVAELRLWTARVPARISGARLNVAASCRRRSASTTGQRFGPAA